jgi:hypothetical protein
MFTPSGGEAKTAKRDIHPQASKTWINVMLKADRSELSYHSPMRLFRII